jgi:hypothetical protein
MSDEARRRPIEHERPPASENRGMLAAVPDRKQWTSVQRLSLPPARWVCRLHVYSHRLAARGLTGIELDPARS